MRKKKLLTLEQARWLIKFSAITNISNMSWVAYNFKHYCKINKKDKYFKEVDINKDELNSKIFLRYKWIELEYNFITLFWQKLYTSMSYLENEEFNQQYNQLLNHTIIYEKHRTWDVEELKIFRYKLNIFKEKFKTLFDKLDFEQYNDFIVSYKYFEDCIDEYDNQDMWYWKDFFNDIRRTYLQKKKWKVYLDDNWITIKASRNCTPWYTYQLDNLKEYYVAINKYDVRDKIKIYKPEQIVTTFVKDMSMLFEWLPEFNEDVSSFDTSHVKDMYWMFWWCCKFNQNIWYWNVSQVQDFDNMFSYCEKFNQNIWRWNMKSAKRLNQMFNWCASFNNWWSNEINNWNVSHVEDMWATFYACTNFNQPLNKWNVSKVNNMADMFWFCTKFNQNLNNWNVNKVHYLANMFKWTSKFNNWWKIITWKINKKADTYNMFIDSKYDSKIQKVKNHLWSFHWRFRNFENLS